MDLAHAKHIFDTLYADVNGYALSSQARSKLSFHDKAHTYGEITPDSFNKILQVVAPKEGEVFYDLGSGTGKAVILATLLSPFSKITGIEILKDLSNAAQSVLHRLETEFGPGMTDGKTVECLNRDFLTCDLSDADVIFTHSTCFYDELWINLVRKIMNVKPGTRVVTVTKTIEAPGFTQTGTAEYQMGWGRATVNFYRKV